MISSTRMGELLFSVLRREIQQRAVNSCACCCNVATDVLRERVTGSHLCFFGGGSLTADLGFLPY